ncbi:hypothetical protein ES708_17622 [subsurface metagenome]
MIANNTDILPARGNALIEWKNIGLKTSTIAKARTKNKIKFKGENEKHNTGKNTRSPVPIWLFKGLNIFLLSRNNVKKEKRMIVEQPKRFIPAIDKAGFTAFSKNNRIMAVTIANNSTYNGIAICLKS